MVNGLTEACAEALLNGPDAEGLCESKDVALGARLVLGLSLELGVAAELALPPPPLLTLPQALAEVQADGDKVALREGADEPLAPPSEPEGLAEREATDGEAEEDCAPLEEASPKDGEGGAVAAPLGDEVGEKALLPLAPPVPLAAAVCEGEGEATSEAVPNKVGEAAAVELPDPAPLLELAALALTEPLSETLPHPLGVPVGEGEAQADEEAPNEGVARAVALCSGDDEAQGEGEAVGVELAEPGSEGEPAPLALSVVVAL